MVDNERSIRDGSFARPKGRDSSAGSPRDPKHGAAATRAVPDSPLDLPRSGASDVPPETRELRCPACRSETLAPAGRVTAVDGVLKIDYQCAACATPFVHVRRPVDFIHGSSDGTSLPA